MSNSYGSGLAVDPAFNSGTFEVKDLYFKTTLPSQRGMHRVQPLAINDKRAMPCSQTKIPKASVIMLMEFI